MNEATKALNNYIKELYDLWAIDGNEISDGIHTFGELYDYRMMYNALFVNEIAENGKFEVFKTKKHYNGDDCLGGGWFLVSVQLPTGTIDNHYENKYWDLFHCPELEKEPYPYDGHTSADVLARGKLFARKYEKKHLTAAETEMLKSKLEAIDKERVVSIEKVEACGDDNVTIVIWVELKGADEQQDVFYIENLTKKDFGGMLFYKKYTPEELGLDI